MSQLRSGTAMIAAWLALVGGGQWLLLDHATRAGAVGAVPNVLPKDAALALGWSRERPLLLVAAHPQCPCLPATLDQLGELLPSAPTVDLRVLVLQPHEPPATWDAEAAALLRTGLLAHCVVDDRDGELAARIGARTSGHVSLYLPNGTLAFAGGITLARGHAGENAAARALRSALFEPPTTPIHTAVFGCPMTADGSTCESCCRAD